MHILHFLPVYAPAWQFGGPILSVSRLCEGLVQNGVDVRVITTNAGLPDFPVNQLGVPQNVNGVSVIYYPVDQQGARIRSRQLVEALPEHMAWADILHLSSIWQPLGLPVQNSALLFGVPIIQSLRGALGPYSWRRSTWKKLPYFFFRERPLLQRSSLLHCTTPQEAREISWLRLKPPVELIPNPIDLTQLGCDQHLAQQWRKEMGLPHDEKVFLVVGRLHHKKGLDILPHVLRAHAHKPWHIVFVGHDSDGTGLTLRRAMADSNLSERCHWLPPMPAHELRAPYNAADWLLLPSHHENFGNVVIEALACGCGVLLSDRVGVVQMLSDCPGVYFAQRRKRLWIDMLEHAFSTSRPGQNAEAWVKSQFSKDMIATQAYKLYLKLGNLG